MLYKRVNIKSIFAHMHKNYNVNHFTIITVTVLQFSDLFISCKIVNYIGIEFEQEIYSSYNTTNFPKFPCFYNNAT